MSDRTYLGALRRPNAIDRAVALNEGGLVLGLDTRLARMTKDGCLDVQGDRERLLALCSVAGRRTVSPEILHHIDAAAGHWQRGDKALANLRLVFAGLPRLDHPVDAWRLRLAEMLLDEGLPPRALMRELELDPSILDSSFLNLNKSGYNPNQPRVPAGSGPTSGRWEAIWNRIVSWLEEPVPEYDTDTGIQVGTRTRGRAIATSPLTVGASGTAALLGGEAVAGAGAETYLSSAESEIVSEARSIVASPQMVELAEAHANGLPVVVNVAGRVVQYEPGLPASGMTLFGENGFVMGPEAFASDIERSQTVLHELYRLRFTNSAGGVSADLAREETTAAADFAARAARLLP